MFDIVNERMREWPMIAVTFDPARGYITPGGDALPFTALSLSGLRRKLEGAHVIQARRPRCRVLPQCPLAASIASVAGGVIRRSLTLTAKGQQQT